MKFPSVLQNLIPFLKKCKGFYCVLGFIQKRKLATSQKFTDLVVNFTWKASQKGF